MGFLLHGKYNYVFFSFYIQGKKYRYSTKIKIDKSEWDVSIQRPKARRGDIGAANKKITFELNEYQKFYEKLKSNYKESLTNEIVKNKFDQHFQLAQTVKALTYSDYSNIYRTKKRKSIC